MESLKILLTAKILTVSRLFDTIKYSHKDLLFGVICACNGSVKWGNPGGIALRIRLEYEVIKVT